MIALHTDSDLGGASTGYFHPFPNVIWDMGPWGSWRAEGEFEGLRVLIEARCDAAADPGILVSVPTSEGMVDGSRETFEGKLRVQLWRGGDLLIDLHSSRAALELGGGPWDEPYVGACEVSELARSVLAADPPLDRLRDRIPGY